ncbi:phosphoribosyl-ATP diphosphatase [Gluconacetobacter sacchari]|uniref:Phosphoribosyl-ATP pyrophosphatase n=2 Tax=Gluconacetobacter sacchari TaxID=92759 RepID=A0A7W4ID67_9PROT|nr:phosphoribosyl-ATP diphosphatase [Gluconacetobacter sacchari]MBB2160705.1 phosphoribosyl-ATP diphosphatase [Gluconacetobacter sacchari]GBQ29040.1 phosphoribosyl ATP pyrophosphatase [Gluconacetobacter sacchari DSM 12717]
MPKIPKITRKNPDTKAAGKKGVTKKTARKKAAPAAVVKAAPTLPAEPAATAEILDRLFNVVVSRQGTDPTVSHSARLLSRGRRKIAQKFGEEAVECLIEAVAGNTEELVGESADVLYHLIVMWVDAGIHPSDVWAELTRREGTSGIAEKASRPRDPLAV